MAKYKIIPSSRTIVQSPISIGHKAEKGVEAIEFDLTAWVETYGSGTLTVIMRRWGDAIPYPIALEIDENNKATWTLSDTDTAKAGMAYAQLSYVVGETVVKKSDIYTFRVMDSLTGEGEPPEAYESWLEHLTHLAAEAMAEVLDIEGVVTDKTLTVDGGIADAKATGDALALKADKSTTYTKTEVDALIESVDVETDTTLSVSGKPADAKKTGDEISALKADLDAVIEVTDSVNRFNGTWLDGYVNMSGVSGGSGEYAHTEKIPVLGTSFVFTGSNIINVKRMNIPCRFITAYDDNGNVLSAYGQQRVGSDNSFIDTDGANIITVDSSVKSVVLSVYKPSAKYTDMCVSFDTSVTDYVPYREITKIKTPLLSDSKYATIYNYLHGKTIAVFGDSIMYGAGSDSKGAVDLLAEKYGMTVAKYCVSGATMGVRTDSPSYTVDEAHHIAKQVRNAIADDISPDIIVFNGGTNDIGGGITMGTMSEVYTQPATESYFADGFETVAYLLTNTFVGVPIIYMRAHNMSSRSYTGQVQYGELGNEISRKWGIATVDMYKKMNTQLAAYRTLYLADYTHPNANGYKKYYIPALEDYVMSALAEVN